MSSYELSPREKQVIKDPKLIRGINTLAAIFHHYLKPYMATTNMPWDITDVGPGSGPLRGIGEPIAIRIGLGSCNLTLIDWDYDKSWIADAGLGLIQESMPRRNRLHTLQISVIGEKNVLAAGVLPPDQDIIIACNPHPHLIADGGIEKFISQLKPGGIVCITTVEHFEWKMLDPHVNAVVKEKKAHLLKNEPISVRNYSVSDEFITILQKAS